MPTASMKATSTVARTYAVSVRHDCSPAFAIGARAARGSRLTRKRQIFAPSRRKKNVVNSTRNVEARMSNAVVAVDSAPVVRVARWSLIHFCPAWNRLLSCASDRWKTPFLSQFWMLFSPA